MFLKKRQFNHLNKFHQVFKALYKEQSKLLLYFHMCSIKTLKYSHLDRQALPFFCLSHQNLIQGIVGNTLCRSLL